MNNSNQSIASFSGCDSETDTEEFEKVGQSPIDRRIMSASTAPKAMEMATSTEQIETATAETLTEVSVPITSV